MSVIAAIAGVVCGSAIFLFFSRLDRARAGSGAAAVVERRPQLASRRQGLTQVLDRIGRRLAGKGVAADAADGLRAQLNLAGNPGNLTPAAFNAIRVGLAAVFVAIALAVSLAIGPSPANLAAAVVAAAVGYFLPVLV
ncbi:MAG: hypothetical protein M3Z13_01960, partial [Candidatus Dormibacteraeota bacterium]|nr:hypothetical protein [Candidatus Dormibacteraeota bacterium]